ncbi:GPH family glycoside/pentoside/hexuronide:cation symporter [Microbacterium phyllosphaerae]|uniref:GPH family glycoside/pentoside/hexuronide:cation symporter n=1 Tax=Microbacterium phyllosphaerae TaxID=124798 RepID=A0ABS4WV08_9MICO|nr:MFS transporter [Microbacterium phyllosphaerae]MBP2379981.1 GPH family glycoside/pentoside/hexuronide:cation symporter [Microbacterium phyllosphaerae]
MTSLTTRLRDRRLNAAPTRAQAIAFGASGFPTQLMTQTFSAFVVYFYVTHLGVEPTWVAAAMIAHGVLNAVLNPVVGALSDRIRTPWGRRIPWIGLGIVPLVVAFALVWMPPELPAAGLIVWFLIVVAVYDIAFVVVVLNISALFPEIFRTTDERARGNVPRQIFAILGIVLGTAGAPALYGRIGWPGMAVVLATVCLVLLVWSFVGGMIERRVPEAASEAMRWRDQLTYTFANRAFVPYVLGSLFIQTAIAVVLAAIPFYVRYSLGAAEGEGSLLLGAIFVTAIPSIVLWSAVVRRTSPRTALLWSVAVFGIAMLGYLLPSTVMAAALVGVAVGVGVGGLLQLLEVVLAQIIDEDAVRTGHRREGAYFGVNGFVVRGSVVLQAIVAAVVLTASGFDASLGDAQPEAVDGGIRVMVAVVPLVFAALAWLCFWLYPIRTRDLGDQEAA